jgi:hypothetical protein
MKILCFFGRHDWKWQQLISKKSIVDSLEIHFKWKIICNKKLRKEIIIENFLEKIDSLCTRPFYNSFICRRCGKSMIQGYKELEKEINNGLYL